MKVSFAIEGVVPSLKNQKRISRGRMHDDAQVVAYKRDFGLLLPARLRDLQMGSARRFLRVDVRIYHDSWRRDIDAEIVFDLLQASGVISNDRWIRTKFIDGTRIDPLHPRAEIDIYELAVGV